MLDFSGTHILILLIVALVVIGPKDLPKFLRMIGQAVGKMRRMADQFRTSFDEMARQSELDELRKEIAALRDGRSPDAAPAPEYDAPDLLAPETHPAEPILPEGATPAEPLTPEEPVPAEPQAAEAKQS